MKEFVQRKMLNTLDTIEKVQQNEGLIATILDVAERIAQTLRQGGKLMIAGNGGSAADAQHLAAEFISRLTKDRPALHAVALTTDSSILTAIGNDYGYENVFSRQIEALGKSGDAFMAISTSGNSANILKALELCPTQGVYRIGLTGGSGGKMMDLCDSIIVAPSSVTQNIQEAHLMIEHILCGLVERHYFGQAFFA